LAFDLFKNLRRLLIVNHQSYNFKTNGCRLRRPVHPLIAMDLHPMEPL